MEIEVLVTLAVVIKVIFVSMEAIVVCGLVILDVEATIIL